MEGKQLKDAVRSFWQQEPCGSGMARSAKHTREFFDEIEEHRYTVEPFIHQFAQFSRFHGKKVLEIGVGAGTDHAQFARAGAVLTGVDLTEASVEMTRTRLALEDLKSDLRCADAEHLPFDDNSFDYVYSWGVLHHTPDTEKAIDEVYRVCRPGGRICVMLYHRFSVLVFRLWLIHGLLKLRPFRTWRDIVYHHMESVGTKAYTRHEARRMFARFSRVEVTPVLTPYDTVLLPRALANCMLQRLGWFLVVRAWKDQG